MAPPAHAWSSTTVPRTSNVSAMVWLMVCSVPSNAVTVAVHWPIAARVGTGTSYSKVRIAPVVSTIVMAAGPATTAPFASVTVMVESDALTSAPPKGSLATTRT